jgi:hypothetical protein
LRGGTTKQSQGCNVANLSSCDCRATLAMTIGNKLRSFTTSVNHDYPNRHAELVSASHLLNCRPSCEILKQVQDDLVDNNSDVLVLKQAVMLRHSKHAGKPTLTLRVPQGAPLVVLIFTYFQSTKTSCLFGKASIITLSLFRLIGNGFPPCMALIVLADDSIVTTSVSG